MKLDENELVIQAPANGRTHYYVFDKSSPLGEMYDVVCALRHHILQAMQSENKVQPVPDTQEIKE